MSSSSPPPRPVPKKPPSQNPNVLRASVVPPLPPRSPDIRPTPIDQITTPSLPPRSPDLHSTSSPSLNHHHHNNNHNTNNHQPASPQQPPLPPRTLPPTPPTNSPNHNISNSKFSFDDISKTVHTNQLNNHHHQSATISHHSTSSGNIGGGSSSGNIQHPSPAQSKYGTYRKPLPTPPSSHHEDSRLSLKTPSNSAPHPPIPPRSGSALSLSTTSATASPNHNHSNRELPTPTPTTMAGKDKERHSVLKEKEKDKENRETIAKSQDKSSSSSENGDLQFVRDEAATESSLQSSSNHPSLDHLAAFTSLRDLKAKEILTTERTYCDNMKILVEVFIEPLKYGEGGISKDSATIICSNLSDILLVSVELLSRLEERLASWSTTQRIGDVFITLIPFLKMYTNYTVGFDNALATVSDCEKNSSFVSFIQKCTEDPRTKKLDLRSYLIQPVQRITRYHMLLDELLKHTDPAHPDYADLAKSLAEMKRVTNEANEAIKRSENRAKVLEIQKMFVGDIDIVAAHRSFVFEGVLTKVCRKACKKRNVFLFSDLLLYGSSMPPKLLLHEKINLEYCRIEDIPDGDSGGSRAISLNGSGIVNAFQICSNKKSFVVFADTPEMKMLWMLKLIETIGSLQEKRSTLKSENKETSSEAPVWVPDETTTNCPFCEEAFTLLNRRHHCRNCGELVCGKCSEKKFKLPISNFKAVRVCNPCYEKLSRNPPQKQ